MGDEVRRTQKGNNNAYCQDNELSWFDWTLLAKHAEIHRFVKSLIMFRERRDLAREGTKLTLNDLLKRARVEWHGVGLRRPDWGEHAHCLAFSLMSIAGRVEFHAMLNAYWEPLPFELPRAGEGDRQPWRRWIDTSLSSPDDICDWDAAPVVSETTYTVAPRSVVFLARRSET